MQSTWPIAGRERELAVLERAVEDLQHGRGGVQLVTGEAGIGKSRLLEEVCAMAHRASIPVAWGPSWEAGGAPPYWPWTQALRAILELPGAREALNERRTRYLSMVLPELDDGDLGTAEGTRFEVLDAAVSWLVRLGRNQPIVVVLDDLHAADPDSIALLATLIRALSSTSVLVIGASREEGNWTTSYARALRAAPTLALARLTRDQVHAVLHAEIGDRADELADAAHARSEGNPLFLVELLALLRTGSGLSGALPPTIHALVSERLGNLTDPTRTVLDHAAILGRECSLSRLQSVFDVGDATAAVHEAQAAALVVAAGSDRLRFSHELIREVLEADLGADACQLHLRAGRALRQIEPRAHAEIAHHLLDAGSLAKDEAIEAGITAATDAESRMAYGEVEQLCTRLLDLLDGDDPRAIGVRVSRARARIASRQFEPGLADALEGFEQSRLRGDARGMAEAALASGNAFRFVVVDQTLVSLLEQALDALPDAELELRVRVMARLAAARQPAWDMAGPIELGLQAIELGRDLGARTRLETLRNGCSALVDMVDAGIRIPLDTEYLEVAAELGSREDVLRAHRRLAFVRWEVGQLAESEYHQDAAIALSMQLDDSPAPWVATAHRAARALWRGEEDRAEALIQAVETAGADNSNARLIAVHQRATLARIRGDEEAMERASTAIAQLIGFEGPAGMYGTAMSLHALPEPSRSKRIRALAPERIEWLLGALDHSQLPLQAEIASALDDRGAAQAVLAKVLAMGEGFAHQGVVGCVLWGPWTFVLGDLHETLGDARRAREARLDAIRRARAAGGMGFVQWLERQVDAAPAPRPVSEAVTFAETAAGWSIAFAGSRATLPDVKGVAMIARLVQAAGREIHAVDLANPDAEGPVDLGDSGEVLDARARAAYRERAEVLAEELTDAQIRSDAGKIAEIRRELEFIADALTEGVGLGGRARRTHSNIERARVSVRKRIKDGLDRIKKAHPAAGDHLDLRIRTGVTCMYQPPN